MSHWLQKIYWEFWFAIIGGIVATLTGFFLLYAKVEALTVSQQYLNKAQQELVIEQKEIKEEITNLNLELLKKNKSRVYSGH